MLTDFTPIQKLIWIRGGGLIPSEAQYETIKNVSVATFTAAKSAPLKLLEVAITSVQAAGTPTPTSPLPISGWISANVTVSPTLDAQDGTAYQIPWQSEAGTVYGGTLNVTTGLLTVNRVAVSGTPTYANKTSATISCYLGNLSETFSGLSQLKSSHFSTTAESGQPGKCSLYNQRIYFNLPPDSLVSYDDAGVQQWLEKNNAIFTCALATPYTYQLAPTAVKSRIGANNVWADTGNIVELTYRKK